MQAVRLYFGGRGGQDGKTKLKCILIITQHKRMLYLLKRLNDDIFALKISGIDTFMMATAPLLR